MILSLPEGGTPWKVFADTGMDEYTFEIAKDLNGLGEARVHR